MLDAATSGVPPAALHRPATSDRAVRVFRGGHVSSRGHQAGREVTTYRVKARARVWTGIRMKHRLSLIGKSHRGNAHVDVDRGSGEERWRREGKDPRPRFDQYSAVHDPPTRCRSRSSYGPNDTGTKEFRTYVYIDVYISVMIVARLYRPLAISAAGVVESSRIV